jgi:hypothetical protein
MPTQRLHAQELESRTPPRDLRRHEPQPPSHRTATLQTGQPAVPLAPAHAPPPGSEEGAPQHAAGEGKQEQRQRQRQRQRQQTQGGGGGGCVSLAAPQLDAPLRVCRAPWGHEDQQQRVPPSPVRVKQCWAGRKVASLSLSLSLSSRPHLKHHHHSSLSPSSYQVWRLESTLWRGAQKHFQAQSQPGRGMLSAPLPPLPPGHPQLEEQHPHPPHTQSPHQQQLSQTQVPTRNLELQGPSPVPRRPLLLPPYSCSQ